MWRNQGTKLINCVTRNTHISNQETGKCFASKFRVVSFDKKACPVTGGGKTIPVYEQSHKNIQHKETGKIFGNFTSNPDATATTVVISQEIKMNGSPGSQCLAIYPDVRIITTTESILIEHKDLQFFVDKQEEILLNHYERKKNSTQVSRTHKNDTTFFNEDGTKHEDFL